MILVLKIKLGSGLVPGNPNWNQQLQLVDLLLALSSNFFFQNLISNSTHKWNKKPYFGFGSSKIWTPIPILELITKSDFISVQFLLTETDGCNPPKLVKHPTLSVTLPKHYDNFSYHSSCYWDLVKRNWKGHLTFETSIHGVIRELLLIVNTIWRSLGETKFIPFFSYRVVGWLLQILSSINVVCQFSLDHM